MLEPPYVLVPRARLGDALLSLVVANNLVRAEREVTVVCPLLESLRAWFPRLRIVNAFDGEARTAVHQSPETLESCVAKDTLVLGDDPLLDRGRPRIEGYLAICRERFGIESPVRSNGLEAPVGAGDELAAGRVVLHPGAGERHKAWPVRRFVEVSRRLAAVGDAPLWLVHSDERERYAQILGSRFELVVRERLDDLAALLRAARVFLGNDSGVSHLASCVGTPTVTLFVRPRIARHWRPAWAPGEVVLPRLRLPGTSVQRHTWHRFIRARDVSSAVRRVHST
ncbi:MAG: glycosyltransferase family 9 protein [bacterium]|nr:glycosyltransferase family 9 protein [bacterium]